MGRFSQTASQAWKRPGIPALCRCLPRKQSREYSDKPAEGNREARKGFHGVEVFLTLVLTVKRGSDGTSGRKCPALGESSPGPEVEPPAPGRPPARLGQRPGSTRGRSFSEGHFVYVPNSQPWEAPSSHTHRGRKVATDTSSVRVAE